MRESLPIMREFRRQRRAAQVELGTSAVIACIIAAWTLAPVVLRTTPSAVASPPPRSADTIDTVSDTRLPVEAFDASLVRLPPKPVVKTDALPPPPPPPPRLILLAVIARPDQPTIASIYDPDIDAVIELRTGQKHGQFTVAAIANQAVELRSGGRTVSISLDPARSPTRGAK